MFKKKFRVIALMLCIVLMMGFFVVNTEAVSTVLLAVEGTIVDGNLIKFKGINGIGEDTGLAATNVVKSKFDATSAPTVNNDTDEGYTVGSRWLDVTNDKSYVCLDNADGAAVWHLDFEGPGSSTDHAIVRWDGTTGRTVLNSVVTVSDAGVIAGGEWQGTVIGPAYGGTGVANAANNTITFTGNFTLGLTLTANTSVTLPTSGTVLTNAANTIDSDQYVDGSIDHEHLAPDAISGMTDVPSADADYILIWDATDSVLKKCDMAEVRGVGVGGATTELDNLGVVAINTSLLSDAADTDSLGSATKEWLSLYIGDAGKIFIGLGQDVTIHRNAANEVTITATSGVTISNGLSVGGTVALGANSITMTGSIAATGSRITKLWTADLECTNDITIGGTALAAIYEGIITGADTLVMFFDGANTPGGEAGFTYIKGTDTLNVVNIACTAISGTLTGTASVAATGDAAVDFFGAGVHAVTDGTACTNIEGTLLSIAGGVLNAAIPEDHINATMLKDDNAPADEDIFCYELTGTTGHWYSRAEVGIGVATSITDGIIKEADLDADAVAVGDILTYDDGGVDFLWKTKAELSIASSGANIDITSILNTALYVGRDADNKIDWGTDDTLKITIAGALHSIVSISDGAGDNDKLVTQGYVDDAIPAAGATTALDNLASVAINTSLLSDAQDTDSLGSTAKEWLNLYIGDAGKIFIGLSQDLSIHRSAANTMTLTASSGVVCSAGLTVAGDIILGANSIGRDVDNDIDFETDNQITFRTNGVDGMQILSSGELDMNANSVGFTLQTGTGDGTTTIDWKLGLKYKFTHGDMAETFTFTAPTNTGSLTLEILEDANGSHDCTWPAAVTWLGAEPTWTDGGANKTIVVVFWYNGTTYWGQGTPWES